MDRKTCRMLVILTYFIPLVSDIFKKYRKRPETFKNEWVTKTVPVFKISKYFKCRQSISPLHPPFCWGDNFQSQILKMERGGSEKNECLEFLKGLKEFLPWIFAWGGLNMFLVKKRLENKICL